MNDENFLLSYVQGCATGKVAFNECGPVWQFGVIAAMLVVAIIFLLALITPPKPEPAKG